mgnify:FL=1
MFLRGEKMIAKYWKKIGIIILIIACLFNITNKIVHGTSLGDELKASAETMLQGQNDNSNN